MSSLTEPTVVALPDPRLLVVTEPTIVALPDPRLLAGSDPNSTESIPRLEPTVMAQPRRRPKQRLESDGAKTEPFSTLPEPMNGAAAQRGAKGSRPQKNKRERASVSLGKYQLLRPLSSGSTSHVFLARYDSDSGSARHLAVKTLRRQHVYDTAHVAAFHDEARLMMALHHRSLAQVFDVALSSDGTHYLAMEYLHGESLAAMVQRARADGVGIPMDFALTAITAAASALHHVHERHGNDPRWQNLSPRELSPANLTAVYDGMVKITAFGSAKASVRAALASGETNRNKLCYLTPEHALGRPVDARSDVFALGVVLYELTTLANPFAARTMQELKAKVVRGEPVAPSQLIPGYPHELEQVVMRALAKSAERRYQSCSELSDALIEVGSSFGLMIGPNAIRSALGQLFGGKIEPWLEPSPETPMPVTTVHAHAHQPVSSSKLEALQTTQPSMPVAVPQAVRNTGSVPVSANVVPRASAVAATQPAPSFPSRPPDEAALAATTLPMPAMVNSTMRSVPPPPAVARTLTPSAPPAPPVVARTPTPPAPPPLPVEAKGPPRRTKAPSLALPVAPPVARPVAPPPSVPLPAASEIRTKAPSAPMPPSALPPAPPPPSIPLPAVSEARTKAPSGPLPVGQSPRHKPASAPMPMRHAPRSKAPSSVPLPPLLPRAVPEPLGASPSSRVVLPLQAPVEAVNDAPSGRAAPLAILSTSPSGRVAAAPAMPPFATARPLATEPPALRAADELAPPSQLAAAASEDGPAPSSMPTLRGHEGSRARVAKRSRSSELISTDEIHRLVDQAHASAWKESRAHQAQKSPGPLAAATPQPHGAAVPARPPLDPRAGAQVRRGGGGTGPEKAAAWAGLAAPAPATASLSTPLVTPVPDDEPSGSLRRVLETLAVIATLAFLALGRPELASVRDSLGLEVSMELAGAGAAGAPPAPPATPNASTPTSTATAPGAVPAPGTEPATGTSPATSTTPATGTTPIPATGGTTTPTTATSPATGDTEATVSPALFKLVLTSQPSGATVLLDGERLGKTPITIERPISDGTGVLRLRYRGYQPRKLDIKRDADQTLDVRLKPEPVAEPDAGGDALGETLAPTAEPTPAP
jgi:eukaryotic-like serine/threonine-protein kinase